MKCYFLDCDNEATVEDNVEIDLGLFQKKRVCEKCVGRKAEMILGKGPKSDIRLNPISDEDLRKLRELKQIK